MPFSYVRMMESFGLSEYAQLPNFKPVAPAKPPAAVAQCRLGLFATVGAHLRTQPAFEPINDLSIRLVPTSARMDDLAFDHPSPIRGFALEDLNVAFPIDRLAELEREKVVREVAPFAISMLGSITKYSAIIDESVPTIAQALTDQQVDLLLMVPFCPACHRATMIISRALEAQGIPCITMSTLHEMAEAFKPARPVFADFPLGATVGRPHDPEMQRSVIRSALGIADQPALPWRITTLPQAWSADRAWEADVWRLYESEGKEVHRSRVATHTHDGELLPGHEREIDIKCAC